MEEDLEALCKLLTTIGKKLDHPKAFPYMKAYFDWYATTAATATHHRTERLNTYIPLHNTLYVRVCDVGLYTFT